VFIDFGFIHILDISWHTDAQKAQQRGRAVTSLSGHRDLLGEWVILQL